MTVQGVGAALSPAIGRWLAGYVEHAEELVEAKAINCLSKVGHGAALHYPDLPWVHGDIATASMKRLMAQNTDRDGDKRLAVIASALAKAGVDRPEWSEIFERSDYRKVHDAIKQHRHFVTGDLLLSFGLAAPETLRYSWRSKAKSSWPIAALN